jgi:hypothetical protein
VQAYGSKRLDASLLLIPLVGFLPASDPRVQGTLRAIENKLLIHDEFVLRYETGDVGDGLPAGEGAFLACSFWLVDNYIMQGRYTQARQLFDRLLAHCNDVGLLSEEFDPVTGPHARQFSAGLQPCRRDQLRAEFDSIDEPGGRTRRAGRAVGRCCGRMSNPVLGSVETRDRRGAAGYADASQQRPRSINFYGWLR